MAKEIQFNFTLTKIKDLLKEDCPKINLDEFEFLDK